MNKNYFGSNFDEFLNNESTLTESAVSAIMRVNLWLNKKEKSIQNNNKPKPRPFKENRKTK